MFEKAKILREMNKNSISEVENAIYDNLPMDFELVAVEEQQEQKYESKDC